MKHSFSFLFKSYFIFFLAFFAFVLMGIVFRGVWNFIPYIFLLFFFYEWNITPKLNKTGLFIESIPLTLRDRYFLRVVFPFGVCFLVLFTLQYFKLPAQNDYIQITVDALRQSSIFLLSSLMARSLIHYIMWLVFLHFSFLFISMFPFLIFSVVIFIFFYAYYILSMGRVSHTQFIKIPLIACLAFFTLANLGRDALGHVLLAVPLSSVQFYGAKILIDDNAYFVAQNPQPFYWRHQGDYASIDENLVHKLESAVLAQPLCTQPCHKLAQNLQSFPQQWDHFVLSRYLTSNEVTKQIYALEVLKGSRSVVLFNQVMLLTQSHNTEVRETAFSLLRRWGIGSPFELPSQIF